MHQVRGLALLSAALLGVTAADATQLDPPRAETFVRAEDRQRARLARTPCTDADVGHGCYRFDGQLLREAPCTYHIDARTLGVRPTDQCVKMDAPRRYRGIWIDAFEGQQFIPDGTPEPRWPASGAPNWRRQFDRTRAARIWLDVDRVQLGHDFAHGSRRMRIAFIGRKTRYPGSYGHMGMSGSEIIVDRVLSLHRIPERTR